MKFNNKSGFSLVEITIAIGLLAALSVGAMKVLTGMKKSSAFSEAKLSELEIRKNIAVILTDKVACQNTFSGISIGGVVNQVKDASGNNKFVVGEVYGNDNLLISTMRTSDKNQVESDGSRLVDLIVGLKKNKVTTNQNTVEVKIQLKVIAPSAIGNISSCFSETGNILEQACDSQNGIWLGSLCSLDLYVLRSGDTMTGSLSVPLLNSSGSIIASQICTGGSCKTISELALANRSCLSGTLQFGVKTDGTPNCRDVTCTSDKYFAGLDGAGNKICKKVPSGPCGANQYISSIDSNGTINCSALPVNAAVSCGAGNFIQDISASGTATCRVLPDVAGLDCGLGYYSMGFGSDGNIVCQSAAPPVNCVGSWGACSSTCDPGIETYAVTTNSSGGGTACPSGNGATRACNLGSCTYTYTQPTVGCPSGGSGGGTFSLPNTLCTNPNGANSYNDNEYSSIYNYWEFNCSAGRIQTITRYECGFD